MTPLFVLHLHFLPAGQKVSNELAKKKPDKVVNWGLHNMADDDNSLLDFDAMLYGFRDAFCFNLHGSLLVPPWIWKQEAPPQHQ